MINTVKGMVQPTRAGGMVIMTTMQRLATINVTINFALPLECLTVDDYAAMPDDKVDAILNKLNERMLFHFEEMSEAERDAFATISWYYDEKYYHDNIDAFLEYQSHMGEPDFDWDFYSDWHKDMYGVRPR